MRNYTCFVWTIVFAASIAVAGAASAQPPGPGPVGAGPIGPGPVGPAPAGPRQSAERLSVQCQSVPDPSVLGRSAWAPSVPARWRLPPMAMTIGPMSLDMPPMVMAWSEQDRQDRQDREKEAEQRERERETRVYDQGRDDLDEGRYDRAIARFTDVGVHEGRARGRGALLQSVCAEQGRSAGRGARDARERSRRTIRRAAICSRRSSSSRKCARAADSRRRPGDQSDEDLKLYAIAALQNSDPEQAVPMLEKVLAGNGLAAGEVEGAVRAGAEQFAACPRSAQENRDGHLDARSAEPRDRLPRHAGRHAKAARCSVRSTPGRPTST